MLDNIYYIFKIKNMDRIFIPILRSKAFAQLNVIKHFNELKYYDLVRDRLIPYIEFKTNLSSTSFNKYMDALQGMRYFYELYTENNSLIIKDYLDSVINTNYPKNAIPSIKLSFDLVIKNKTELIQSINVLHDLNLNIALRIINYRNLENILDILNILTKEDYLILDNEEAGIETKILLSNYNKIVNTIKPKTIFFSIERSQKAARLYENISYTKLCNYNLIEYLKIHTEFQYSGFGSYCGAKNDNNEARNNNVSVEGIFFEYSYVENKFFVTKTIEKKPIAYIYTKLTEYLSSLINKQQEINTPLFHLKEIDGYALKRLREIVDYHNKTNKNSTARNYVEIAIENYIEQIIKFYLLEK